MGMQKGVRTWGEGGLKVKNNSQKPLARRGYEGMKRKLSVGRAGREKKQVAQEKDVGAGKKIQFATKKEDPRFERRE